MSARNTAARVLAKIAGNDPARAIRPSEAVTQAWAEHFEAESIQLHDALEAVRLIYQTSPDRPPLAADVVTRAKQVANQRQSVLRTDVIADCPDCDEYGWLIGPDGAVLLDDDGQEVAQRCTHPTVPETAA